MDVISQMNLCRDAIGSVITSRSAAYAAGPLETGKLYYVAIARGQDPRTVRSTNQAKLSQFVYSLRHRLFYPVIDPGLLMVPGWRPSDYGEFFRGVLVEFAREAHFVDGWEFSTGATKEYIVALERGIPCYAEDGNLIAWEDGISAMYAASEYVRELGLDPSKLQTRLRQAEGVAPS